MSLSDLESRISFVQICLREEGDLCESEIIERFVKAGQPLSRATIRRVLDAMVSKQIVEEYTLSYKKQGHPTIFYKLK